MTKKYEKRPCSAVKTNGERCHGWAVRDSDPPLCGAHGGGKGIAGAPLGNRNAFKHGFYSRLLTTDELADLIAYVDDLPLEDEIAIARVTLRRAMAYFANNELKSDELSELARLVLSGTKTIARLLRDQQALSVEAAEGVAGAVGMALDELAAELGIEL